MYNSKKSLSLQFMLSFLEISMSSDFNNFSLCICLGFISLEVNFSYISQHIFFLKIPVWYAKKTLSYIKFSINQKPNVHFYGNDLCKVAIWSIIIVTRERNNGERGLRTHGRNTNVITINSYLSDLEIQNVHSLK